MKVPLLLLLLATATHWLSPVAAQVADIVTQDFFDRIINNGRADSSCPGRVFYTRQAFLDAAASFQGFGTTGDSDVMRREIAAFFANVKHETGSLCDIEETNDQGEHCDQSFVDRYPCAPGKSYYGRGPLQLTWNYNYGAAGASIGFDGLAEPEKLATDAGISFKAAVWFWMNQCHNYIVSGQGFGETIRAINSRECGGGAADIVANRVSYYQDFCAQLGVVPGDNLTC